MQRLQNLRNGKPSSYPDQAIYAEFASLEAGLTFEDISAGAGQAFTIRSNSRSVAFAAGRCSFYPQNNATAASLANDKYFTNLLLERAGVATLGGQYYFLHQRHRAHRPPGHERDDALALFRSLGGSAFLKPLTGSRGDFAQTVTGEAALAAYLDRVSQYYDAVLMQPVVVGEEYRIFVLDQDVVYVARKTPAFITGDGQATVGQLLARHRASLDMHGISAAEDVHVDAEHGLILAAGERRAIEGRMNRSAGGTMTFTEPRDLKAACAMSLRAVQALGLRAAAIDIFTDINGDVADLRVIEVNANPSIRFLEDSGRSDLILKIWRHGLAAMSLLDV
jgi:hypothetical protein